MSFSSDVKKELSSIELLPNCCIHAQIYGLALFAHFSSFDISLTTENENTAKMYADGLRDICGVTAEKIGSESKKITLSVEKKSDRMKVFDAFGHSEKDFNLRLNRSNIAEECCAGAFLRGAFLACGTVTDPNKNYHLEFVVSHKKLCTDLMTMLGELDLSPKYILRKGYHIVYFKESESIEDLLTFMGATESSLLLMGVKMQKDVVNRVNRRVNFEMSNLTKTIDAANRHTQAIELIESTDGLDSLPESLRTVAKLRIENPEVSLNELGKMLSPPLTRSGVNHRLAKLVEIAGDIRNRKPSER